MTEPLILFLGSAVVTAIVNGGFLLRKTAMDRRAARDVKPADQNAANQIANDLILRLLDRANDEVARIEKLLDTAREEGATFKALADLVPDLQRDLARARLERTRLRKAIEFLKTKAQETGHVTYSEVVEWAALALDPDADPAAFDRTPSTLPDELEDTVTTS